VSYDHDLAELRAEIESLRTIVSNLLRPGTVSEVDKAKGYRLQLGKDGEGKPYLSPWLPHPETGKTSVPLKVGQIVGLMSPTGDPQQGFLLRGGYSDGHKSPNENMDANVFEDAGVRIEVAAGKLTISAGGLTHTISSDGVTTQVGGVGHTVSGDGVATTGGAITHDEKNIGSSHRHGGVARGGALTDPPA